MKIKMTIRFFSAAFLVCGCFVFSSAAKNLTVSGNDLHVKSNAGSMETSFKKKLAVTTPEALVADLYKQHDANKSPFFQAKNRALVDKYFTKATADLIWNDAKKPDDEPGALGADPLYNAQDSEIKNFKVGKSVIKGKDATVAVTFTNFGEKQKVDFELTQEAGNWKIRDIKYDGGEYTLTGFFEENSPADSDEEMPDSMMGEFEGKYQIGSTTATVKPIKMAFEVKWEKGAGTEIFFAGMESGDNSFTSESKNGKANVFRFDDENYNTGTFHRADGKEFAIKRIK